MEGFTDSAVSHKILPVRAQPESLAHKRLGYHSLVYSGMAAFLQKQGEPDYLIEDQTFSKRQIVMFYLKKNEAYLVELGSGLAGPQLKTKGPEPIGKKTRELLDALERLDRAAKDLVADHKTKGRQRKS